MKTTIKLSTLLLLIITIFSSCGAKEENTSEAATSLGDGIQVIQFHSENRCMTCNKIEALTIKTLTSNKDINFKLINVDDANNEAICEQFEAAGTALFLYNPATGNKKDLTDFAFMNAGDETVFVAELQKEIDAFK
jgi:hypothetical protein